MKFLIISECTIKVPFQRYFICTTYPCVVFWKNLYYSDCYSGWKFVILFWCNFFNVFNESLSRLCSQPIVLTPGPLDCQSRFQTTTRLLLADSVISCRLFHLYCFNVFIFSGSNFYIVKAGALGSHFYTLRRGGVRSYFYTFRRGILESTVLKP